MSTITLNAKKSEDKLRLFSLSGLSGLLAQRRYRLDKRDRLNDCFLRLVRLAFPVQRIAFTVFLAATSFVFRVPPEFKDTRVWLERHAPDMYDHYTSTLGWTPPPPLIVEVVRDDPRIPPWATGIYMDGLLLIREDTVERFPEVFRHELAHAFISAGLGRGRAPVWFHEGLAQHLAGENREFLPDLLTHIRREPRLAGLADAFPSEGLGLHLAYAKSQAVVAFILKEAGWEGILGLMADVRAGRSFETALLYRTGRGSLSWEEAFYAADSEKILLTIVTSSSVIWALFAVLLVVAYIRQRKERQAILRAWEDEEDDTDDPDVPRV